jgi:hypothetical protein
LISSLVSSRWTKDVHIIHPPWVIGVIVELTFGVVFVVTNLWLLAPKVLWFRTILALGIIGVVLSTVSFLVVNGA